MSSERLSRFLLLLFILLAMLSACAKKQIVKPSEDSIKAKHAIKDIGEMQAAYEAKDIKGFLSHVSQDYSRGYGELDTSLRKDFDAFDNISIDLRIDRVEIEGDKVKVVSHWFGTWRDKTGKDHKARGNSDFVFRDTGASFLLVDVVGDSPFGISR